MSIEVRNEESFPGKEEHRFEAGKEEIVPKLQLGTSSAERSTSDGLSHENSTAGMTKEQKLALIRERKAKLLTPRSAGEAESNSEISSSSSASTTTDMVESESSDDITSAVITEIRVIFKSLNKHGKPKSK